MLVRQVVRGTIWVRRIANPPAAPDGATSAVFSFVLKQLALAELSQV